MKLCPVCHKEQKLIFSYQHFKYYRCGNCQLVSTYPFPSRDEIRNHYAKAFKKGNYQLCLTNTQQYKPVYEEFVKVLKKKLSEKHEILKEKRVLDIGCFTGDFLELLQEEFADVCGFELQNDAVKIANKKLLGKVIQADVMTYTFPKKKYDIITLLGVVEHVADPMSLLKRSYSLLEKKGIVMIQTPNSSSLLARIMGKYWPPYSPVEHIHLFSRKSLERALEECGFSDISFQAHWKKLPVGYVYNNFSTFGPEFHRILSPLDPLLNKCPLVLPFYGGEMIITASKK